MKNIFLVFIFFCSCVCLADTEVEQKKLVEKICSHLDPLTTYALRMGCIASGSVLYRFAYSVQQPAYEIKSETTKGVLTHLGVLEKNKVKSDVREAFNRHGTEKLKEFGSYIAYHLINKDDQ